MTSSDMVAAEVAARLDDLRIVTITDGEVWSARDLMPFAGYSRWEDFRNALARARVSIELSGLSASDHLRDAPKLIEAGKGAKRQIEDVELTRYGCYILFQNADARKPEIAALQSYFAVQTRKQELAAPLSDEEIVARALQITTARVAELEAKVTADAPKVAYVDRFVADENVQKLGTVAKSIGVPEGELRAALIDRHWIYVEADRRWSGTKQEYEMRHRYSAYADKARYFHPVPAHEAPLFRGHEVMHTLKVTPAGAEAIARNFGKAVA